jgi:hypothetical protein
MFQIEKLIGISAWVAVGMALIASYLKLNKIWKRKHERKVAQSVSLAGNAMDVFPLVLLSANYIVVSQWQGFFDALIWILTGCMMMLVGTGYWVKGERGKGIWVLIKQSLAVERGEVGYLARLAFYPSRADLIIQVLSKLAMVDDRLHDSEKKFIEDFAATWDVALDWRDVQMASSSDVTARIVEITHLTRDYLDTSPPPNQAHHLSDIIDLLVKVDQQVTPEERVVIAELKGLIQGYVAENDVSESFTVAVVPQSAEQAAAIHSEMPHLDQANLAGGTGFVVDSFFSKEYAELICHQYRDLGFFTVTIERNILPPELSQ